MHRFLLALCALASLGASSVAASDPAVVIRNATVFDSATGKLLPQRTILIQGDRIRAIGPSAEPPEVPQGAEVIDASNKYVIPGLIDAHVHLVHYADRTHVTGDQLLPLFLAAGVTTVRSAGDAIVAEAGVAHFAASRPESCPRVILASPLIDAAPPYHADIGIALTDPRKVAAFVDDMARWHVTTLKIYVGTTREVGREVIKQGHLHGMIVTAHLGRYPAQDAAADGIDCLEHIWSVFNYSIPPAVMKQPDHRANLDLRNPTCQALIALLANRRVAVDPTLVVFHAIYFSDLDEVRRNPDLAHVPHRMLTFWETTRDTNRFKPDSLPARRKEILKYQELTGMLHRLGVPILAGTDTSEAYVAPGLSLHEELEYLVASGLTPAEAIQSATINNARIIKESDNLGSIEPGKRADLVILSDDPTKDIRNSRKVEMVIHGGHVARPAELLKTVPVD